MKSLTAAIVLSTLGAASAQVFKLTPERLITYTAKNPYERFADGRPKVPDALLEKMKGLSSEEIMLAGRGYPNQYVGGMQVLHPEKKLVGRAFTVQLMPYRPEIADLDQAEWKAAGAKRRLDHQSALDMLQPGDVLVVDVFGSAAAGGIVGDNLAYYVWKKTGNGFVIDGAIRDLEGIAPFDMAAYFRSAVPPAINNVMVTGVNIPVRIGNALVMPGDAVMGDREGVNFIPPQLLEEVLNEAEITHIHDEWTKQKFDTGKYKSTEIYGRPTDPALIQEYEDYLKQKLGPQRYEEYRKRQAQRRQGAPAGNPSRSARPPQ